MRKFHAFFTRLVTGLACVVSSACFDIREELWIHPDGSGRARLDYQIPLSALRIGGGTSGMEEKIRNLIASQPKLRIDSLAVSANQEQAKIELALSTDSMRSLLELRESSAFQQLPKAAGEIVGDIDARLRGLDIDFSRQIRVREALGLAAIGIGGQDRRERRLEYIIHLPTPARDSNATRTSDGGKTLVWSASLGEALAKPIVTRFRAPLAIPWFVHLIGILLLTGTISLLLRIRRKRRQKHAPPSDETI
ncbi:MAG: hypothetical protein EAZ65_05785 [Verrucomicrobia bacterium]|nr:MAG: hypothetical protein EAZ84_01330 [Verrucomicrobiota bacterium]TAE87811.1 MAG: hypothetical protein EAZ82_06240 [Verrucomicrobiota bacterium]TAF25554.1 MAG: hypothetical protein EAZ71_07165 [Verrucomicrobiota bacterium]TAF41379.1 MAG: hypothetical protein EAZ65_05785 [Verrucomicrobiota bacterium]